MRCQVVRCILVVVGAEDRDGPGIHVGGVSLVAWPAGGHGGGGEGTIGNCGGC